MLGRQFFFISGLPRSGSTLLCNIFAQNPDLYVSPATSGCADILFGIRKQWDELVEHQAEKPSRGRQKRVMRASLEAYHDTDKTIVVDKGRGWLSLLEMLEFIGIQPKVIAPVRDIAEILASFELLWRKSTGASQWNVEKSDYFEMQTVEGRCKIWSRNDQPIGLAYNRLKDAFQRDYKEKIHLMEMDSLTKYPAWVMKSIYNFLGVPYFEHDFERVKQYTKEDDEFVHRIPGLHTIREKVGPVEKRASTVLGEKLASTYQNQEFWRINAG